MDNQQLLSSFSDDLLGTMHSPMDQMMNQHELENIAEPMIQRSQRMSMSHSLQQQMEPIFGFSMSDVNIHTDEAAHQATDLLGARAFTKGKDIYFGEGEDNFVGSDGKALLAHELTHVGQLISMPNEISSKTGLYGFDYESLEKQATLLEKKYSEMENQSGKSDQIIKICDVKMQQDQRRDRQENNIHVYEKIISDLMINGLMKKMLNDTELMNYLYWNDIELGNVDIELNMSDDIDVFTQKIDKVATRILNENVPTIRRINNNIKYSKEIYFKKARGEQKNNYKKMIFDNIQKDPNEYGDYYWKVDKNESLWKIAEKIYARIKRTQNYQYNYKEDVKQTLFICQQLKKMNDLKTEIYPNDEITLPAELVYKSHVKISGFDKGYSELMMWLLASKRNRMPISVLEKKLGINKCPHIIGPVKESFRALQESDLKIKVGKMNDYSKLPPETQKTKKTEINAYENIRNLNSMQSLLGRIGTQHQEWLGNKVKRVKKEGDLKNVIDKQIESRMDYYDEHKRIIIQVLDEVVECQSDIENKIEKDLAKLSQIPIAKQYMDYYIFYTNALKKMAFKDGARSDKIKKEISSEYAEYLAGIGEKKNKIDVDNKTKEIIGDEENIEKIRKIYSLAKVDEFVVFKTGHDGYWPWSRDVTAEKQYQYLINSMQKVKKRSERIVFSKYIDQVPGMYEALEKKYDACSADQIIEKIKYSITPLDMTNFSVSAAGTLLSLVTFGLVGLGVGIASFVGSQMYDANVNTLEEDVALLKKIGVPIGGARTHQNYLKKAMDIYSTGDTIWEMIKFTAKMMI